jgi:hypothetical protein
MLLVSRRSHCSRLRFFASLAANVAMPASLARPIMRSLWLAPAASSSRAPRAVLVLVLVLVLVRGMVSDRSLLSAALA